MFVGQTIFNNFNLVGRALVSRADCRRAMLACSPGFCHRDFDHQDSSSFSGKKSNHDTVTVLFQNFDKDNVNSRKEKNYWNGGPVS